MTEDNKRYAHKDVKNLNADKRAAARGCVVVEPKPNELFIDIDRAEDKECFHRNIGWLGDLVTGYDTKPSTSGKPEKCHIVVRLNRDVKDHFERIGLQAILGSDRLREVLSWRNAIHESGRPTCFFEKAPEESVTELKTDPETFPEQSKPDIGAVIKNIASEIAKFFERFGL